MHKSNLVPSLKYKHNDHKITMQRVIAITSHLAVNEIVRMAAGKVSDEYESAFG